MARKMKDSGVEWIGMIPDEWKVIKLKYLFSIISGNGFPDILQGKAKGDYPFCKVSDINGENDYVDTAANWISSSVAREYRFNIIPCNSILMAKIGAALAKNHRKINLIECCIDNNTQALVPKKKDNIRYLLYLTKCIDMRWFDNNSTIPSINNAKLLDFFVPNISISTQSHIADFLDKQCASIDDVIAKTTESIEEYKKLKQAMITEAVTKGVRGKRPMKDSDVDWIGQIPKEWDVVALRYLGQCQNGISKGAEFFGSGYPFVSYSDVYKNIELPKSVDGLVQSTDEERERYSVKRGDIFFTRTSETIEEIGFTSVCTKDIENATFAGFLIRVRPIDDSLNPDYAKYYFRSDIHRRYFVKEMIIVIRASLGQELLKKLPVLLPSKEEQREIADYLDSKCAAIDTLISKKQQFIDELTAYKKSLIYEFVTGKKEVPA